MTDSDKFEFKKDPDNGMWIAPDDCHYDDIPEAMYACMGLCECGRPDKVHSLLIEALKCLSADNGWDERKGIDGIKELVNSDPETAAELIAQVLDRASLTEHGGSVYGAWLTDRGRQFIEIGPHS